MSSDSPQEGGGFCSKRSLLPRRCGHIIFPVFRNATNRHFPVFRNATNRHFPVFRDNREWVFPVPRVRPAHIGKIELRHDLRNKGVLRYPARGKSLRTVGRQIHGEGVLSAYCRRLVEARAEKKILKEVFKHNTKTLDGWAESTPRGRSLPLPMMAVSYESL